MRRLEKDFKKVFSIEPTPEPNQSSDDFLPEFCDYKDDGCSLAPACLNCPFPHCIYDLPWGRIKRTKNLRNAEIVRLFISEKKTVKDIAIRFKICTRTVIRALSTTSIIKTIQSGELKSERNEHSKSNHK